jgi:subtilisin family serine protease
MSRLKQSLVSSLFFMLACSGESVDDIHEERLVSETGFLRVKEPLQGQYIVVLKENGSGAAVSTLINDVSVQHKVSVSRTYENALRGFVMQSTEAQARAMAADARVKYVIEDGLAHTLGSQTNAPWSLDRVDQRHLPLDTTYGYANTGQGVHVYIIDTGIRASHQEFEGRASLDFTAINDGRGAADCHGHGTHVAGSVGGATWGVAKKARLHSVRVLDCNGSGSWSQVIAGIDWVTANRTAPAVVNMSLGGGANQAVDDAVRNSIARGVVYAIAAGNSGADACYSSPARVAEALTVGATGRNDARASFSNHGGCIDLFAPGVDISSALHTTDSATGVLSGTSMAAPHVAGVAALYWERYPSATAFDIMTALVNRTTPGKVSDSRSANRLLYSYAGMDFRNTYSSGVIDWGYDSGRTWTDFNGDGKADYCRRVGGTNLQSSYVSCTVSTGTGFGATYGSDVLDWGYEAGRAWVDFNGDGKSDYCRVVGSVNFQSSYVSCTVSTGTGFGATYSSGVIDWGYDSGRTWTDFNGDGKADYCRRVGGTNLQSSYVSCTVSTGTGFGATYGSDVLDWGYAEGQAWVDYGGDGKKDYCRVVGSTNFRSSSILCNASTGTGFAYADTSGVLDWGYAAGRAWVDFNGDGKSDYCRVVGSVNFQSSYVSCSVATGQGFVPTSTRE